MLEPVVGALEQVLAAAEEASALEALPEAAAKAPMGAARFRPRPLAAAAASPPEPPRDMSEVSGTFCFLSPSCLLAPD